MKPQSTLSKSFQIFHSFFSPVCIAFLLDLSYTYSSWSQIVFKILFIPLKVFLLTGIYSVYIQLASGEKLVFSLRNFKNNVKEYWKIYILCVSVPYLLHFIFFQFFNVNHVSMVLLKSHLDIVFVCCLAFFMIHKRYIKPFALTKRSLKISFDEGLTIVILGILNILVFFFSEWGLLTGLAGFHRILLFVSKYLHFFSFTYIALVFMNVYPEIPTKYESDKELYIINPYPCGQGFISSFGYLIRGWYPALFVILKALTPKDYRIRLFNHVLWQERYYKKNVLVAITCMTNTCFEAYKIAKEFKRRGSTVIMGGPHVTYLPDEALEFCDSVVIGEAENIWKQVVADYEKGSLQKIYYGTPVEDYIPEIQAELLNSSPEVVLGFLETTRGCKYKCHFCTIPGLCRKIFSRPIEQVVDLVKKVKGKEKLLYFIDCNIYTNPPYAKELFKALKPLKIKWNAGCSLDIAKSEEALQLAKESGCVGLGIGYEIPNDSLEKERAGKLAMVDQYIEYTKRIKRKGIKIKGGFIWGWETDNYFSIFKLWRYCFILNPWITALAVLTPLPGSQFFNKMVQENRLSNLNWRRYTMSYLVYDHKYMKNSIVSVCFPILSFLVFLTASGVGWIFLSFFLSWGAFYFFHYLI